MGKHFIAKFSWLFFALLVLAFSAEAFYIQTVALSGSLSEALFTPYMQRLLLMDLATALLLVVLPRPLAYIGALGQLAVSVFILSFVDNLGAPPTASAVINGFTMVQETNASLLEFMHLPALAVLFLLMVVKIWLRRHAPLFKFKTTAPVSLLAVLLLGFFYVDDYRNDRLDILKANEPEVLDNPIVNHLKRRGFLATWAMEVAYDMPNRYQMVYKEVGCNFDRIRTLPIPAISSKISLIQVESLDWAALHRTINRRAVAPHLQAMAAKSLVLPLEGTKHFVSANSEYEMLNSKIAQAYFLYYEYITSYSDSIMLPLKAAGFETAFIHGVNGNYMNRANVYPKLGFDQVYFFEQLKDSGCNVTPGLFEYNVADVDLMRFAAGHASQKDNYLHFMITVTMHASVPPKSAEYEDWHGYYRSVNYFDEGLGEYLDSLPEGSTVILYGDHQSYHGPDKNEIVPFLVYVKGQDLSLGYPVSSVYTRCEVSHYLRKIFSARLGVMEQEHDRNSLLQATAEHEDIIN